jgi:hypothetical protein
MGDNAGLYYFGGDSQYGAIVDSSDVAGTGAEHLSVTPAGDMLYIIVDGSSSKSGTRFTLKVAREAP